MLWYYSDDKAVPIFMFVSHPVDTPKPTLLPVKKQGFKKMKA